MIPAVKLVPFLWSIVGECELFYSFPLRLDFAFPELVVGIHGYIQSWRFKAYAMYVQVAVLRLLKQLSQVYSTLKISKLKQLIPFMLFSRVEALIVDAVQNEFIQVCSSAPRDPLPFFAHPFLPFCMAVAIGKITKTMSESESAPQH